MSDWKAHLDFDFMRNSHRLFLFRRLDGHMVETVTGFDEFGNAEARIVDTLTTHDQPLGFLLPPGAVEAIAEAITPGPSRAEMQRVVEALDIERRRVDGCLELLRGPE